MSEEDKASNDKEEKDRAKYDKKHTIVIYGFTIAIFAYLISTSYNISEGFTFKVEQIPLIAAIIGLLLFRYFDVIKFGNWLELSNKVKNVEEKTEQEGTSFAEEIEILNEKIEKLESKHDFSEEKSEPSSGGGSSIMSKYSKAKTVQKEAEFSESVKAKAEPSTDDKWKVCFDLLEDPDWRWRTKKKLMKESGMNDKEFNDFINKNRTSAKAIFKSSIPDKLGNELFRLKSRKK